MRELPLVNCCLRSRSTPKGAKISYLSTPETKTTPESHQIGSDLLKNEHFMCYLV